MGRFKNEAIMARRLTHPNAVRVDDLDIAEDGLPFIAMELVVGDTLETVDSAQWRACRCHWFSTFPCTFVKLLTPRTSWGWCIVTSNRKILS